MAISNPRLVSAAPDAVGFRYRDYAHGNRRRIMRLEPLEFLRRFSLHVLPRGFNRHYGMLANRNKRALLTRARAALAAPAAPQPAELNPPESVSALWQRVAGLDITRCPNCRRGTLRVVAALAPPARSPPT